MYSRPDHTGAEVSGCMRQLHEVLEPTNYFEISQVAGEALSAAICPTIAVSLGEPAAPIVLDGKPELFICRGDGDAFFARHDPRIIFGAAVDLALLDGLPLFEIMLRNFIDLERHCRQGSVVVFNNCLPLDAAMAGRDPEDRARREKSVHPEWWTGDAWKLIPILQEHRPDLTLYASNAQPTGLLAVTGLDPASDVLANRFDWIVDRYRSWSTTQDFEQFTRCQSELTVLSTVELVEALTPRPRAKPRSATVDEGMTYRFVDPAQLPRIEAAALMAGTADGRRPEDPDVPRTYFRAAPRFIDDPAGRGIIGPFGNDTIRYQGSATLSFRDALLVGYRSILTSAGLLVHDESQALSWDMGRLAEKLSQIDDEFLNEHTGLVPAGEDGNFKLQRRDRQTIEIDEPVVVLCSNEPSNYGSFIYRVLPKLRSIRYLELDGIRILIHAPQPHHREYLEAFGIPWESVIHHDYDRIYRMRHAIVPTMRNIMPYLDAGGRQMFDELRHRLGAPASDRRVYLSRLGWSNGGHSVRVLLNEEQLIVRLANAGFDIIEPETMSLSDQIQALSSARMVVGPAGSALYNTVFCHPGTKVIDIESEPQWVPLHSCLFASLGLPYGIVIGETDHDDPRPVHKRWRVDVDAVMRRIDQWECGSST